LLNKPKEVFTDTVMNEKYVYELSFILCCKVNGILTCEAGCVLENLNSFLENEG
jgi:hypothetical protein